MKIVLETLAKAPHQPVQLFLPRMGKRRMADIVSQRERFRQVLIQTQRRRDRSRNLGNLDGMGQTIAEVIRQALGEHLSLVLQPPEGARMHDAVAVSLKFVAVRMGKLRVTTAACTRHRKAQMSERGRRHFKTFS